MKINLKIIIGMLVVAMLMPVYVFADAYPEKMNINATVNIDGSMTVEENIVWRIEESINGVYRDILCFNPGNELNSANEIVMHSVEVNGVESIYSETTLSNGNTGMYNLNRIEGGAQVKIFHPTKEHNVNTVIKYTLTDVVVEYNDIAELYWNFIGNGWAGGLEDVTIRITLPQESETLKIFGHGPLDGYSQIIDDKTVELYVSYLRSSEPVDARLLFDTDIVYASKFQNVDAYERIMAEELILAKEADQRRKNAEILIIISWVISISTVIVIICTYTWIMKKAKKTDLKLKYYRELPEDYGVPVMNYLLNGYHKSNENMLATLMDLVRKKYIEIIPITKEGKNKPEDYQLRLVKEDLSELNEIEQHYINKLIFVKCKAIKLKELKKKNTASTAAREKAGRAFDKWQELIYKEYKERKLKRTGIKKIKSKAILILSLCFVPTFLLTLITIFSENIDAGIPAIIVLSSYIYVFIFMVLNINKKLEYTEKALEHKVKWKAFKKFLNDFSRMEEKDYGSIVLWEHYLVYAIGLGIADKVLKQLKDIYPEMTTLEDSYTSIYYHSNSFNSFSSSFNSASTGAFTYSSSTGSGGGFSGGGGGRRWPVVAVADFNAKAKYNCIKYIGSNPYIFFLYLLKNNIKKYIIYSKFKTKVL